MIRSLAIAALTLTVATPALAETPAPAASAKKEKKICRQAQGARTGTRMGAPRICKTKAQWDTADARALQNGNDTNQIDLLTRSLETQSGVLPQ